MLEISSHHHLGLIICSYWRCIFEHLLKYVVLLIFVRILSHLVLITIAQESDTDVWHIICLLQAFFAGLDYSWLVLIPLNKIPVKRQPVVSVWANFVVIFGLLERLETKRVNSTSSNDCGIFYNYLVIPQKSFFHLWIKSNECGYCIC